MVQNLKIPKLKTSKIKNVQNKTFPKFKMLKNYTKPKLKMAKNKNVKSNILSIKRIKIKKQTSKLKIKLSKMQFAMGYPTGWRGGCATRNRATL